MDVRKRGRTYDKTNGGAKKSKSGCPFGENCHFLHYFPGGYNAVAQLMNLPSASSAKQNGPSATTKSKLCKNYTTAEGCKFGDQCNFAHGEWELGRPIAPSHEDQRTLAPFLGRPAPPVVASSFGASATAKISVDASLAGAIIGKGGVNSKQICRQTGAKLAIRDHESDTNLKNIELEGTFDQIKEASSMVRELISSVTMVRPAATTGPPHRPPAMHHGAQPHNPIGNKKTKLCENFVKGACTYGERCNFAHGATELRKTGV